MSNGHLNKAIYKINKQRKVARERLKDSISRDSSNPFIFEKKPDFWKTEQGQVLLAGWARDGLSDEQIAANMNIGTTTFYRWIHEDTTGSIRRAIMDARYWADYQVENSLFKLANGYDYEEEMLSKDGCPIAVSRHQPANIEAIKYILGNRRSDKWKAKQSLDIEATQSIVATVSKADELARLLSDDEEELNQEEQQQEALSNDSTTK